MISATNTELADDLHWPINTVTPRVKELRGHFLVVEMCKRKCYITGRTAIEWRTTTEEEYNTLRKDNEQKEFPFSS